MDKKRSYTDVKQLFDTMRSEMLVMEEYQDNEETLLNELLTCSDDIYEQYLEDNGIKN